MNDLSMGPFIVVGMTILLSAYALFIGHRYRRGHEKHHH